MHVGRVMITDLITIPPTTSLVDAQKILDDLKISHLLVVDKNEKLIGVLSELDLKRSWASPATTLSKHELNYLLSKLTVDMIMVKNIMTTTPDTRIGDAARTMLLNRINSLPVMENDELVGLITSTDVMTVLLEALGIDDTSMGFVVLVKDRTGIISDVSNILKEQEINIRSLLAWPEKKHPGIYQLVIRVNNKDGDKAVAAIESAGYKVLTQYVKDLAPYLP